MENKYKKQINFDQRDFTIVLTEDFIEIIVESPGLDDHIFSAKFLKNQIDQVTSGICSDIQALNSCLEKGLTRSDPNIAITFADDAKLHVSIEYEILNKKMHHNFFLELQVSEENSTKVVENKIKKQAQIISEQEKRIKSLEEKNVSFESKINNLEASVFELKNIIDRLMAEKLYQKPNQEEPVNKAVNYTFDLESKNCEGNYVLSNYGKKATKKNLNWVNLYCGTPLTSESKIKFRLDQMGSEIIGICFNSDYKSNVMDHSHEGYFGYFVNKDSIFINKSQKKLSISTYFNPGDVIEVCYDPVKRQVEWRKDGATIAKAEINEKFSGEKCYFIINSYVPNSQISILD